MAAVVVWWWTRHIVRLPYDLLVAYEVTDRGFGLPSMVQIRAALPLGNVFDWSAVVDDG